MKRSNSYPYRSDSTQAKLDHLPSGPYAFADMPYLSTMRYAMIGFEARDVEDKAAVDAHGIQDNIWWDNENRRANRAGR